MKKEKNVLECLHLGCNYSPKSRKTRDLIRHQGKPHLCDESLGCSLEHTKPLTRFICSECNLILSSKERVESHKLKKHIPKPTIIPVNDLASANAILNSILNDRQKKQLMDICNKSFDFEKIREMVEKFEQNKKISPNP